MQHFNIDSESAILLFLHLPKSAGMTLEDIFRRQFEPTEVFSIQHPYDEYFPMLMEMTDIEQRQIRYLSGHYTYGIHKKFKRPYAYITFLRHPIKRIISYYRFALADSGHYLHDQLSKISLREVFESKLNVEFDNDQVRRLSGAGHSVPFGQCGEEMLTRAKSNLEADFPFVGIMERFDESLVQLGHLFHWKRIYYLRKNVTDSRIPYPEIDEETLALLECYNQLDIDLYNEYLLRFENRVSHYRSLGWQVRLFKMLNKTFQLGHNISWEANVRLRSFAKERLT